MGFPASGAEALYRNNINDVVKFLNDKHRNHYMVYNLCDDKTYDHFKFNFRVVRFPFAENGVPRLDDIQPLNDAFDEWLDDDPQNTAAIHNKDGKGSVGLIIVCYLLHKGEYNTATEAIQFFNMKRCNDNTKGLCQPSQIRWCRYYEKLCMLKSRKVNFPGPKQYKIEKIFISKTAPKCSSITIFCHSLCTDYTIDINNKNNVIKDNDGLWIILETPKSDYIVRGDFSIEVYNKGFRKSKVWSCWLFADLELNDEHGLSCLVWGYLRMNIGMDLSTQPTELIGMIENWYKPDYIYIVKHKVVLNKSDLDKVYKQKKQKDFQMIVYWNQLSEDECI